MNILFINANLHGHINPTLGFVKKLTERGNQVSYFCSESFNEQVTDMGAKWIGYGNRLNQFFREYRPTDRHPFYMLMEYILLYDEVVLPEVLELLKEDQYDVIICDSIFGGALFLKQITSIPVVCSHSSFAMSKAPVPNRMLVPGFHPQLDHCYEILKRICERYEIEQPSLEEIFISKGERNIVYTISEFNGDDGVHEPDYIFTGPSIGRVQKACELDLNVEEEVKVIYISLGSFNTDYAEFYKKCIEAFGDTEYKVYMSIGKKCDIALLGDIPSNFIVRSFMPQLEILKRADVFITHAGFNSVNEALYHGVPMLALPQVNDQHMVAKRLATLQLGVVENIKELTSEILKTRIEELVSNSKIKENCTYVSQDMQRIDRMTQAVSQLEKYIEDRKEE